ncbi:MAG: alpha/beta fold hydrolase [Longimicrobiales bacterium]
MFGLVHGGGFGAWCWDRVVPALRVRAHSAVTIDLSPDDLAAGATRCGDVVAHAFAGGRDLVIVGHSIAGLFIPLVTDRLDLRRLVFLHALLPRPGQSVVDQMAEEPDMFNPEMFAAPAPFWEDESVAVRFLLHDCEPDVARAAFRRLRPEPGVLGREVSPLRQWPGVPCAYIVCTDDRTANPAWARRAARERLGIEPLEIPGGHCPMLSRPEQLAEVLSRCA